MVGGWNYCVSWDYYAHDCSREICSVAQFIGHGKQLKWTNSLIGLVLTAAHTKNVILGRELERRTTLQHDYGGGVYWGKCFSLLTCQNAKTLLLQQYNTYIVIVEYVIVQLVTWIKATVSVYGSASLNWPNCFLPFVPLLLWWQEHFSVSASSHSPP